MGNPIWFLFWLIVLLALSFIVAGIGCFFYVLLYMLETCIPPLKGLNDFLLKCVQFPHYCSESMLGCKSPC